ncbi:MAG: hypothetical protein RIA71_16225 [Oceanicaulis sp.]
MTFLKLAGASALAIAISTGASAQTQTHGGEPGFGVLGFDGSAASLPARAGGALSLEGLGCYGYSTIEPSAAINVGASGPLYIAAGSDIDLTLAVRGPDGEISCSDDDAGQLNPGVVFDAAAPGLYEVWIGTYGAGEGYPPVWLNVSADAFNTENPYIVSADPALPAAQTLRLAGGFRNDPQTLGVTAGGPARMSGLDMSCYGRTGEAPAAALDYRGGALPLFISLSGEADTTIGVITPGGEVLCNDDAVNADAGVMIEAPEAGRYTIFAGLYDDRGSDGVPATLAISEIGYGGVDRRLDVAGDPVFGAHQLAGGFMPDPASYPVEAGGAMSLSMAIGETAMGGWCPGNSTRTPTMRLTYDGAGPLFISMESDTDTTLAVNGPDGAWTCDDDSLGDLNPSLSYDTPRAGVYDIYAGTFSDRETAPATIYVSEIAGGADPSTRMMDVTLPALAATLSLEPGFAPDMGRITVTAGGPAEPVNTGEAWCPGSYTNAPSVELSWAGGPLSVSTEGDGDTTLAVNLPNGDWICDDDGGEGLLSRLDLSGDAGVYDIWVGTFGGDEAPAVLQIDEPRG